MPPTDQLVLIGCDSYEGGLREDEGTELLRVEVTYGRGVRRVPHLDDVQSGLVLVHRVEDDLL